MAYQMDLFAVDELHELRMENAQIKEDLNKLRRSLFARLDQLVKQTAINSEDIYVLQIHTQIKEHKDNVIEFPFEMGFCND